MPMSGFDLRISGVGGDRFANCTTITAQPGLNVMGQGVSRNCLMSLDHWISAQLWLRGLRVLPNGPGSLELGVPGASNDLGLGANLFNFRPGDSPAPSLLLWTPDDGWTQSGSIAWFVLVSA